MRKSALTCGLLAMVIAAAACHRTTAKDKPWADTTSGGGIGVPAGAAPLAGMGNVFVRRLLSGRLGRQLDSTDRQFVILNGERTLEQAPDGRTLSWESPHSGNSGSITAIRTYQVANGTYCRDYRQTITVGEENEELSGTACRRLEGFWGMGKRAKGQKPREVESQRETVEE